MAAHRRIQSPFSGNRKRSACSFCQLGRYNLVHDDAVWRLCDEVLDMLRRHDAVEFIDVAKWSRHAKNGAGTRSTSTAGRNQSSPS
jgi:hypothetical protein